MHGVFPERTKRFSLLLFLLFAVFWSGCREQQAPPAGRFEGHPLYKNYRFSDDEKVIELGCVTPWSTVGQIIEVMKRDEILKRDLAGMGYSIKFFPFLKGGDIQPFLGQGTLEGAAMGDMPTLVSAANGRVMVLSVFHKGSESLVSRDYYRVRDLKNKRVAYPYGAGAHFFLLKVLKEQGLSESDIRHAPMDPVRMLDASAQGRIDAFATFEPTATIFTRIDPTLHAISRSFSSYSFLSLRKDYALKHRRAALAIIAAQLRAEAWLRESDRNIHEASQWVAAESAEVTDLPLAGHLAVLDALCAEALPQNTQAYERMMNEAMLGDDNALQEGFEFLKQKGLVPRDREWKDVAANIDTRAFREAMNNMPQTAVSRIRP